MDLKNFLPNREKKSSKKNFWAVIVEQGWVQAGIWTVEDGKAKVPFFSAPAAWGLDEELINATDASLSSAIQEFPESEAEPSEAVFGVTSSWVEGGEIKPEFLEKIKKICTELALTPVGFVVLPEAIAHFIKSEEESPVSAVIIGVYNDTLGLTFFKQGNLIGNTQVARSVSVAEDVAEGLTRFAGEENVFSRFILYDGKEGELEEVRQDLLKVNWDDYPKLNFLHTPKVEIIDHRKKISAVALAGASEMANIKKVDHGEVVEAIPGENISEEPETEQEAPLTPQESGFVINKDITKEADEEIPEAMEEKTVSEPDYNAPSYQHEDVENVMPVNEPPYKKRGLPRFNFQPYLEKMKGSFAIFGSLNKLFGAFRTGKNTLIIGLIFLVTVFILGFAGWWFMPKSSVTIYVSPKQQGERITIKVDSGAERSNFDEKILKGQILDTSVSGDKTKSTSGTKTVGEKAKGEVTIYRVGSKLDLASGTVIHGPSNLDFTLDNDVEVASGSAGSAGTTKASVTAEDIGAQFNLAADTNFTVDNYSTSDMEAKNESSFSGGTSREIQAVSDEDQKTLSDELKAELTDKAKEDLKASVNENQFLIEESLTATSSGVKFSNKVGDEADSLKLDLTIDASVVVIDKTEMLELASKALSDKVPSGFILREEQIDVTFEFDSKRGKIYEFNVNIEANLLPDIKTEEVVKQIRGKYPEIAKDFMTKDVPGFVRAEIRIKPNLPGKLNTLPKVAKNIEVEIAAEK